MRLLCRARVATARRRKRGAAMRPICRGARLTRLEHVGRGPVAERLRVGYRSLVVVVAIDRVHAHGARDEHRLEHRPRDVERLARVVREALAVAKVVRDVDRVACVIAARKVLFRTTAPSHTACGRARERGKGRKGGNVVAASRRLLLSTRDRCDRNARRRRRRWRRAPTTSRASAAAPARTGVAIEVPDEWCTSQLFRFGLLPALDDMIQ